MKMPAPRYFIGAAALLLRTFALAGWAWHTGAVRRLLPPEFPRNHRRRLRHYFYGTTYLAALFAASLGTDRTRHERRQFVRLAALAAYFDDLTDLSTGRSNRQDTPAEYGAANDPTGVSQKLLEQIRTDLPAPNRPFFQENLQQLFQLETSSPRETDERTECGVRCAEYGVRCADTALLERTAKKGGYSVLLFRALLEPPLQEGEIHALHAFGNLIQWCDDVFDLWFDLQAGAHTPAATLAGRQDTDALAAAFEEQVAAMEIAFRALPNTLQARGVAHYIVALGRLCIDHYRKLQQKHGTLPLQNRQALVVDMDRWKNRLLFLYYLLK